MRSSFQRLVCTYPGNIVVASKVRFSSRNAPYKCSLPKMKQLLNQLAEEHPSLGEVIFVRGEHRESYQNVFCKATPEVVDQSLLKSFKLTLRTYSNWYNSTDGPVMPRITWGSLVSFVVA